MKKNLISILTPTHDRGDTYLPQTIRSVQLQKQKGFDHEHIIVDNLSTDNTAKIVKEFAKKDKRIIYVKNNRNLGAADGLNVALKRSKGELIVPLDDDDVLPRSSLQMRFNFFQKNPKVKWAYGYSLYVDQDNRITDDLVEFYMGYKKEKNFVLSLLDRCFIPNGTVTVKRECIKKVGGWSNEIKTQDYDMWLKLAAARYIPYLIESYLVLYRTHKGQVSIAQQQDGTHTNERQNYLDKYSSYLKKK